LRAAFVTLLLAAAALGREPHYDITMTVAPAAGTLAAEVTIALPAAPAETTLLLGRSYAIGKADARGATVTVGTTETPWPLQQIVVHNARAGSDVAVHLRYAGPLGDTGAPPLNAISPTLVELNLDSMATPLPAGLSTRFTLDATVDGLPSDLVVCAPGRVTRARGRVSIHRDVPDIDFAFVAMKGLRTEKRGDFELVAADHSSPPATLYARHGAGAVTFLERWFGPLPGRPVRVVVVRRERVSGYARRGYIVVTESPRPGAESGTAKFIAHELAHAWWSPVDPNTEDRWLQESLAEFVALRYVEETFGVPARDGLLARKREAAATAGPLLGEGVRGDAELYAKGPILLFALESQIGRDKLDRVLRDLAPHPPHVTAEFLQALARVAGAEAARTFEASLR
jgi:ribosomal protein S18 acetylase RimI-like enzyme